MSRRWGFDREAIVASLRKRDGEQCWLCQTTILFWPERHDILGAATIDHVLPWSLGGGNDEENLRLAHYLCNNVRGNSIDADEIKARIGTLFIDGEPARAARRRQLLVEAMSQKPKSREPVYPFCAWPRVESFRIWPIVDSCGNVALSDCKPEDLH
jgi:hypothetical protein